MSATKRDTSRVFGAELKQKRPRRSSFLDTVSHLSHRGIRFTTGKCLPEWTEVGVEMQWSKEGSRQDLALDCQGVIVECVRRECGSGFEVSLLFLDLSDRVKARLSATPPVRVNPLSLSIHH